MKGDRASEVKESVRKRVWEEMERQNIARFPRPVFGRIPNFVGAETAARRLAALPEFGEARVVKVNPDSPQRPVRELVLSLGKVLLMPTPRLRGGFVVLESGRLPSNSLRRASTIRGALQYGVPVGLGELPEVDLLVMGSVAVSRRGARVGKGGGYGEIEFAILQELGLVRDGTPIATTVHEVQIVEGIPLEEHDVPVDIIVTPKRVIESMTPYPRPRGLLWNKIGEDAVGRMPILRELRGRTKNQRRMLDPS